MIRTKHGSAVIEVGNDRDVVITREFDAPVALVFYVLTKPEHVSKWFFNREVKECSIDLRVGGNYRFATVMNDGTEMAFYGTFLEIDPPIRFVDTWRFDLWPDAEAVESVDLEEANGVTKMINKLQFSDQAGLDRMVNSGFGGIQESYDRAEDLLTSLLDPRKPVSE